MSWIIANSSVHTIKFIHLIILHLEERNHQYPRLFLFPVVWTFGGGYLGTICLLQLICKYPLTLNSDHRPQESPRWLITQLLKYLIRFELRHWRKYYITQRYETETPSRMWPVIWQSCLYISLWVITLSVWLGSYTEVGISSPLSSELCCL